MAITRRRLCSATVLATVGVTGCLGGGESADDAGVDGTDETPADDLADWAWSGTLPVDSVVQHHDPGCGCCSKYVEYLERHDFDVRTAETTDLDPVKAAFGVPDDARSCHTVEFGDYLVEGHVPLEAVETLFAAAPDVAGIAAPGMPQYAPGMGPRGEEPLELATFDESGEVEPFTEV